MTALSGDSASPAAEHNQPKAPSNLTQRMLTIVLGGPIALLMVYFGGWFLTIGILLIGVVGVAEFYLLAHDRPLQGSTLVGVPAVIIVTIAYFLDVPPVALITLLLAGGVSLTSRWFLHRNLRRAAGQAVMTMLGVLYIGFPAGFLLWLRATPDGLAWLLLILALTWGTDSFAYVGGRLWGRRPLAPVISPKKTVEGAIVGYFGGFLAALLVLILAGKLYLPLILIAALGPVVAILGDLFESWLKRRFNVKDSHLQGFNLFPGHGGVLDRVDALIWVTVLCYAGLNMFGFA